MRNVWSSHRCWVLAVAVVYGVFGLFGAREGVAAQAAAGESDASDYQVTSFTLINADTNQPIAAFDPLTDGATLNLATLPTRHLNIRANTSPSIVGGVEFWLDEQVATREQFPPYAIFGDQDGNYWPWTPTLGEHTMVVTPYGGSFEGPPGTPASLTFVVVDEPGEPIAGESITRGANGAPRVFIHWATTVTRSDDWIILPCRLSDDGLPAGGTLRYVWDVVSGPGSVEFGDIDFLNRQVPVRFSTEGTYVLELTADDGELSASDRVTVTVVAGEEAA